MAQTKTASADMTPRERFIAALERKPLAGRVPHFELVFFLTMEAFGKLHPTHRSFWQWEQMSSKEKQLQVDDIVDTYIVTAEKYEHSAIFWHETPGLHTDVTVFIDKIRQKTGKKYFITMHGDPTLSIPSGEQMEALCFRLADEPEKVRAELEKGVNDHLENAARLKKQKDGLDGFTLCCDYCFNTGPFLSPNQFSEFVTPYLKKVIKGYRDMGYYVIKHTDGNIMPILDQLLEANPHALHSLDPQGGVDMAEIKKKAGDKVCLIGNVNCALMQTGTKEQVGESVRYALKHGMPGGGYIFSTSNCIYTGMPLERYDLMLDIWRKEGNYK